MRIACVSDVCLGYGSPQIPYLIASLSQFRAADNLVVEPHRAALPACHYRFPSLNIRRTPNRLDDPYTSSGRIEYLVEATRLIDEYSPDLLVICSTFCLPVLFKLRKRPSFVLYYSYESIPHYGEFDVEMNRSLKGMIDLVVFPEENRAVCEIERFGFGDIPKIVVYNCPDGEVGPPVPPEQRNDKFIYAGFIDRKQTLADYYTMPEVQRYPIDLYGPIRSLSPAEHHRFIAELKGEIRYRGHLDTQTLLPLRRQYAYSIVLWNPSSENQLYAAPNKFFESIADGVPPIAAPHPQCKLIIERYHCGILMPDWSLGGFTSTLERAARLRSTDAWLRMVENCRRAYLDELNWPMQFEKLKYHLRK
jgi:hypothetical protein